jgi:predicted phosphodiesterase
MSFLFIIRRDAFPNNNPGKIYFISDTQLPMWVETLCLKAYKNKEARDSLFSNMLRHNPENVFMLGDLVSRGTSEKAWQGIDAFLHSLQLLKTNIYATPGNHEYYWTATSGIKKFLLRFPEKWLHGYCVTTDSMAIIMLNSNFKELANEELLKQQKWYKATTDSLDSVPAIKTIIVCTHHAPYSNSKIVGSSKEVIDSIVPRFKQSRKAKLFISGHSHNLEYFKDNPEKYFVVIGGGGGITQPLISMNKRRYQDLIVQEEKPVYFYLIVERKGDRLLLTAKGFKKDFKMFELNIGVIML